ncbi:DUF4838 domain-containing protein [Polaribacter sp. KT25b]|uniref:DUF4838 domain-containing protein n=1 Tax=Polaribacter sp. KT25b TaxID=1855336 RepID=UPI0012FDB55E|nr:DUF4838 domain-containing protein [Polaribacter sp. KT25b]
MIFLSITSCAQKKNAPLYSKEHKIYPKINIPLAADKFVEQAANEFRNNFKKITGHSIDIERSNSLNSNYNYIVLRVNPTQKENYCFYKKDNNITIQAFDTQNLVFGINAFFQKYTPLKFKDKTKEVIENTITNEIEIPNKFSHCSYPDFEYREPYFSTNFDPNFRGWNKTNYLELEWGLWGHNISKILKKHNLPETVYAQFGNRRVKNQYCFTSDSLFKYVNEHVKNTYESDHALNKYMILPNDNNIVCTCNTCKAVGNTTKDAAPAIFTFLNKLAENYKNLSFFTTAYVTVKEIPKFKAEPNVGLFYSTINIQKGVPIEFSKYYKKFENDIKKWRSYVNNVYIWDYTVNFDNYFDIYPSIRVTQLNLQLYKKLGVNGVFLHGSEYDYSAFQDLKATLFAKLLWNTNINIDNEIDTFFHEKYPKKLAGALANYYSFVNNSFFINKKELGIYSGIHQSIEKYLDPKLFFSFYEEFDANTEKNKYDKEFLKIATALTFLKLEIMRDYGLGTYGFATLNKQDQIIVKNEAALLLDRLTAFSKSSKLKTYNELKFTLDDYIKSWRQNIFRYHKRKHYFYKKPFKVLSKLDEDYRDISKLNDAAFGLKDYNTNWLICSIDDLILKIDKEQIKESKKITFSFLQDTKHAIFYPSVIEILDTNYKVVKKLKLTVDNTDLATKEISIDLPTKFDDEQLPNTFIVKITKSITKGKKALACDEIIFN